MKREIGNDYPIGMDQHTDEHFDGNHGFAATFFSDNEVKSARMHKWFIGGDDSVCIMRSCIQTEAVQS